MLQSGIFEGEVEAEVLMFLQSTLISLESQKQSFSIQTLNPLKAVFFTGVPEHN